MRSTRCTDSPSLARALGDGVVVLDGGLATALEARGHDLSSARSGRPGCCSTTPARSSAAHREFFAAGRAGRDHRVVPGVVRRLRGAGLGPGEASALLRRSVELAPRRAAVPPDRPALGGGLGRAVRGRAGRRVGVPRRLRADGRQSARLAPAAAGGAGRRGRRRAGDRDDPLPGRGGGAAGRDGRAWARRPGCP